MKSYFQLMVLIILLFSTACSFEEMNIFPESAAVRLENTRNDYNKVLCSATNGWSMEYFPTDTTRGFTVLVKFHASGEVDIASKNEFTKSVFKKDTSTFEMIADNGPVLSFNSYNPLFHIFANPEDPKGSSDLDGLGMSGDYEFIVLKADTNEIKLKGKKRGTYIYLKRLLDNQLWTDYFSKIDAMNILLFNKANNRINLVNNSDTLLAYYGASHQFKITEKSGNPKVDGAFHSFIITPTGIRLHTPYFFNDRPAQTFNLNADNSALVCSEIPDAKFVADNLNLHFTESRLTWTMDTLLMSPYVKTIYNQIVQSCKTKYNKPASNYYVSNVLLKLVYSTSKKVYAFQLSFKNSKTTTINFGEIYLAPVLSGGDLSLVYNGTGDNNGKSFYTAISGYKEMTTLLTSSFTLGSNTAVNPQDIKFSHKTDNSIWFSVILQ